MPVRLLNRLEPVASAAAVAVTVCAFVFVAYRTSPVVPLAALAALVAAATALVRPVWVVFAAILALPMEAVSLPIGAAGLTPAESLFALPGVLWAGRQIADGRLPVVRTPLTVPLAALVLTVLPGLINAEDDFQVVKRVVMWSLFFLTFNMIVAEGKRNTPRDLLIALAAAGGIEGLITIASAAGGPSLTLGAGGMPDRHQGTFDHPNTLGLFVAMALPASVAIALRGPAALRAPAIGSGVAMMVALALSLSRGGLIGAVGALVVFLAVPGFRRLTAAAMVAGVVVALLALSGAVAPLQGNTQVTAFEQRLTGEGPAGADKPDDRVRIWTNTPRLIGDHLWFGIGAYNFREFSVRYGIVKAETRQPYSHAHNVPLTIFAEMGLLGLAAFLWVMFAVVRVLIRACSGRAGPERVAGIAIAGTVTAVVLQGLVDDTIGANAFAALTLSLIAGATLIACRPPAAEPA